MHFILVSCFGAIPKKLTNQTQTYCQASSIIWLSERNENLSSVRRTTFTTFPLTLHLCPLSASGFRMSYSPAVAFHRRDSIPAKIFRAFSKTFGFENVTRRRSSDCWERVRTSPVPEASAHWSTAVANRNSGHFITSGWQALIRVTAASAAHVTRYVTD